MSIQTLVAEALASKARDMSRSIQRVIEYGDQVDSVVDLLNSADVTVSVTKWDIMYQDAIDIKRIDLPKIRAALGSLSVAGKAVAGDFNTTNEIVVTVQPKNPKFKDIRFRYRSPFRSGGKCYVESQVSSYQTLVCRV
jgi:hypothetical protein